ncbi:Alpha/Beta hydrolase protein [Lipomyces orientalis]|uniref:Alpha/Beta hydrolase protein n=1 Tax=Lipomyces orientalis TaxID=1233043 RepID=A0ACC3TGX2_9ASCO
MAAFDITDSYHVQGIRVFEYLFVVPLDYNEPTNGLTLKIFARRVVPIEEADETDPDKCKRPYIVYLQGGPGFECEAPLSKSGRTKELIDRGYQVLYLDQRGTGYSAPISIGTLQSKGTDEEKARYLSLFRADSIIHDCEEIRLALLNNATEKKWSLLGQSFGGFCAVTYLSFYPESLKDVLITGGVPPLTNNPDAVYEALYKRVIRRNKAYYEKFPKDIPKVRKILSYLATHKVTLPNGGILSVERFQQLGLDFGRHQGLDSVHQLVSKASFDIDIFGEITFNTRSRIESAQGFDTNILYACIHEAIYCQGEGSNWSAERLKLQHSQFFSWDVVSSQSDPNVPIFFTGEMIFKSMFDDYAELRDLKGAADILAAKTDWAKLYDIPTLNKTSARVSAVSYFNDIYVDLDLSVEAASQINGCRQWVTSEFLHNGLTVNPSRVLGELFRLLENDVE